MDAAVDEVQEYYALTRKAFDLLAPIYHWMTLPLRRVRPLVVEFSQVQPGAKVLDVATGTGEQAFAFARSSCDVIGVDLTDSMLQRARQRNREGKVKFEVGDATHLRFATKSFDITCISFALHDMPPFIRQKVISEMIRVTKLDGRLIVVDYDLPQNKLGRILVRWFVSLYEGKYYDQFIVSDMGSLLESNGIEVTDQLPILAGAGRIWNGRVSSTKHTTPASSRFLHHFC